jgi:hypothetical protein
MERDVITQIKRKNQRTMALKNPMIPPRLGRAALRCRLALGLGLAFGFIARLTDAFAAASLGFPRYLLSATKGRLRLGESLIHLGLLA